MAYQDGFVASIIVNGKPVRETRGRDGNRTCLIPFDSEYAIRLKNNTREYALVDIDIDSTSVTPGASVILGPGESEDIERFVGLGEGNRFKFVSLGHGDVQDPSNKENGLISIRFRPHFKTRGVPTVRTFTATKSPLRSMGLGGIDFGGATVSTDSVHCCATSRCSFTGGPVPVAAMGEAGATVEGHASSQMFCQSTDDFIPCGSPVEMKICLRGCVGASERPWRVDVGGNVYYRGEPLRGVESATVTPSGDIVLTIRG